MAFMKKKRFKFQVQFEVEELSSVPLVNGVLFAKIRQLDGGSFTANSSREEISEHQVKWKAQHSFLCKMVASANTGVLEACVCRVSVRKELKGGKSFQKLGFADVNLAEFAGCGSQQRRYLLEGYDSKKRQDNSILKVNVHMTLLSSDPCFQAPRSRQNQHLPDASEDLAPENKGASGEDLAADRSGESVASGSSGFGSLPRKEPSSKISNDPQGDNGASAESFSNIHARLGVTLPTVSDQDLPGHTRNASCTSNQSKVSGYSSAAPPGHSRHSSWEGAALHRRYPRMAALALCSNALFQNLNAINLRAVLDNGRGLFPQKLEPSSSIERRVDSTRVDAMSFVDQLIQDTDLKIDESAETSGLQLFIAKDGTTALGTQQIRTSGVSSKFEPVIMDNNSR
ncbi:hypothetical protein CAPTEDRAFT_114552 [Capitella teleta]|uniref:C2 NT-type domain-containing protein n=1 Tax=Capitella teleta TaxID=283909 RepID=R7V3E6_CAPTE|nr:hypothetical protein CAPTEDRAFT_114552 [Capitella teleta]|eukprot:ELU13002.1 hypothetical protein CAPTEDRAFT_114552 [Capitella teleta]